MLVVTSPTADRLHHGRPHIGANGVSWPPWKNGWKIKKRKHAKKSTFLHGWWGGVKWSPHIFQMYFRMHHFVVIFSKFSSPQAARGHWPPNQNPADPPASHPLSSLAFHFPTPYLRTPLDYTDLLCSEQQADGVEWSQRTGGFVIQPQESDWQIRLGA